MNKSAIYLAVFAVLCVLAGVLVGAGISRRLVMAPWPEPGFQDFAQRAERLIKHRPMFMGKMHGGPVEMLAGRLNFSPEQKAKVSEIMENTRLQIDNVGKGVRETIVGIREAADKQIMDVLTPEQQEKFKALQKECEKMRRMHGFGREGGPMHGPGGPEAGPGGDDPGPGDDLPPSQQ